MFYTFSCVTDSVIHFGNKGRIYIYIYCENPGLMPTVSSKSELFSSKKERVFFHYIVICLCDLASVVKINLKSTLHKKHPYGKETALL